MSSSPLSVRAFGARFSAFAFASALLLPPAFVFAQDEGSEEAEEAGEEAAMELEDAASVEVGDIASFMEAVELYLQGKDAEGLAKLQAVIASDPDGATALAMRDAVSYDLWARLLAKGGDHETVAQDILRRARVPAKARRQDESAIRRLIDDLGSDQFTVRQKAAYTLGSDHGPFAVPYFQKLLGNPREDDHRVNAMHALSNMGHQVVTPLVQMLSSSDDYLRQNVAIVLANIGDGRAVPSLLRALGAKPGPALKVALDRSLARCGGANGKTAAQAYVDFGRALYSRDPNAVRESGTTGVFWKWNGESVQRVEAPAYLVPLLMAEDCAAVALALDATNGDASTLLIRSLFAQSLAVHSNAGGESGADGLQAGAASWVVPTMAIAKSAGRQALYAAQQQAIAENDTDVANALSAALGPIETATEFPVNSSLTEALKSSDKSVRYNAALAVAAIDPKSEFENKDQVVPALLAAAAETIRRQILVIDDVEESRNELVRALRDANYFVTWSPEGLRGLQRAITSPTIDLVIVRSNLKGTSADAVLNELSKDFRTANTPCVILSPEGKSTDDQNTFGQRAAGYVELPLKPEAWGPAVTTALGPDKNEHREWALQLATVAAERLANLAMPNSGYTFPANAAESLLRALDHPDPVRVPAIVALGRIGNPAALDALVGVTKSAEASPEARGAAARAIGEIGAASKSLPVAAVAALTAALGDSNGTVRDGAAAGLAVAPLSQTERQAVYAARRLDPAGIAGAPPVPEGESGSSSEDESADGEVEEEN
jgi:HEAT repeat protein